MRPIRTMVRQSRQSVGVEDEKQGAQIDRQRHRLDIFRDIDGVLSPPCPPYRLRHSCGELPPRIFLSFFEDAGQPIATLPLTHNGGHIH
jgi:hypothetical protein